MKKLLLSATACLTMAVSSNAQDVQPCGTYQAREIYLKTVPGYAAKLNAAEAASKAEYEAFLKNGNSAARTASLDPNYTFTVPVVFHVLHLGEAPGTGTNINDALCAGALDQVNKDYGRKNADTTLIDPLFEPLYVNSHMHFVLAKKDPNGNCTNGVIHHYDPKTNWDQSDLFNYQYSTMAAGNWNPNKYLNIYIVKNIIGSSAGIIVGYTHLPGTAPITPADAIVYRYDFLTGINARSLSHEIGHWFGLSHTFGSTNDAGVECGGDDISDTPKTTGFFSTCPSQSVNYTTPNPVTNPTDSSDIVYVSLGNMKSTTALNSLASTFIRDASTTTGTVTTTTTKTINITANGTAGSYSDFNYFTYPNDFATGAKTLTIKSLAKSVDNNYAAAYIDFNRNGSFNDAGENVFNSSATSVLGTQTFTGNVSIPSSNGLMRMRVITSNTPITGPNVTVSSGEFEDYLLNVNLASCDSIRPNIENIMDYSGCPRMFTKEQTKKVRQTAVSSIAGRDSLVGIANLIFTGILDANGNPTGPNACAPVADFASNKVITCANQSVLYTSTAYNSTPSSYLWTFDGGTPSTSTLAAQSVTYSNPGTYSVSLTVTNANGSSSKTVGSYITTNWNAPPTTLPYFEGFESGQWWPAGMTVVNPDLGTPSWSLSPYGAGPTGASSVSIVLPNANSVSGFPGYNANVDILETPSFDFTNTSNISFSFDYSFARKTGVTQDTFKLQYSLDCGGSWVSMPAGPTAAQMAVSGGTVNAPYIPWSSATTSVVPNPKWVTKSIPSTVLGVLTNKRSVKFRFWFQNDVATGKSQNLYIDNINISGTVGLHEFENSLSLAIYPNPTSSSSSIEFISPYNSKVDILVYDVMGRMVEQGSVAGSAGVESKYTVNTSSQLKPGIYFITIGIEGRKVTKKLIIE
ncbi:MAG: T9SS type A sorting domain-containing protein [Bacteroidetes bacterium]|nr:T9SS type A sorting domain-containing protein [Bacteroidota bacterium]